MSQARQWTTRRIHTHILGSARLLAATCWSTAICPAIRDVYPANLRVCSFSGCCTAANKKCLTPLINYRLVNVLFRPMFHRRVRQRFSTGYRGLSLTLFHGGTPCFHSISLCKVSVHSSIREFSRKRQRKHFEALFSIKRKAQGEEFVKRLSVSRSFFLFFFWRCV